MKRSDIVNDQILVEAAKTYLVTQAPLNAKLNNIMRDLKELLTEDALMNIRLLENSPGKTKSKETKCADRIYIRSKLMYFYLLSNYFKKVMY